MNDPLFDFDNQIVLVSGASRGIGYAIAKGFAERNAQVIILGRDKTTLKAAADSISYKHSTSSLVCDVSSPSQIKSAVKSVIADYGHIDTLINVAGVNRRMPATAVTEEDYDFIMDINIKGAFILSQEVGRHMIERGKGNQINISSLNTDRPLKNVLPYAMSKSAMGHMVRGLATEWGAYGVRVNGLAPGFILTDLTNKLWSDPNMQKWNKANTPMQRLGIPEDMVGTALFLASKASAFMTGQILYVDGGFTAGFSWPIPK
jgi:gluconate 5-dehydrogenase